MFNSPIEEIKNRLDIIEVIGSYIKLKKAGANYRAVCPFHSEKSPSFFVSPVRQIWHCFGCGKGGDIFGFVKEIENLEFGDALRILAQKAGVELKPQTREEVVWKTQRERLYEIAELACQFFEKQLEGVSIGKEAKEYLLGRGISEESVKNWRLGYSPDKWQGLFDFLTSKGYKADEIEKVGLAIKKDQGGYYDRFRGRIMFPVFDLNSQVVGFGGRVFKEKDKAEVAKYVNTSNTLLYDKSRTLYGLNRAKLEIRKKNQAILVEGYTDVIMSHQTGHENVVAASGTALTFYQLAILKRYSENIILAFDMDIAGDTATKRGIDLAQAKGFNIKILNLPEGKDPADVISEDPKAFGKAIENSISILDFYFQNASSKFDKNTIDGKKEISKVILPVIKIIPNQIEKNYWTQQLCRLIDAREEDVNEELKKTKSEQDFQEPEPNMPAAIPKKLRKELLEERLLFLFFKKPDEAKLLEQHKICDFSQLTKDILAAVKDNQLAEKLAPETKNYYNALLLKSEIEEMAEKEILPEIQFCLKEIQSLDVRSKLEKISRELKKAESDKNLEKIKDLVEEFSKVSKEINII